MANIVQASAINTAGQVVPGLKIIIAKPGVVLNGAPTNTIGIVGAASWGALNSPVVFSGTSDGARLWGPQIARTYDMMTGVAVGALQGCQSFIGVRVSDGTDVAASGAVVVGNITQMGIVAKCSGTAGNGITFTIGMNTDSTWRAVVSSAVLGTSETFDKIPNGGAAAIYASMVAAVNAGSQLVVLIPASPATPYMPTTYPATSTLAGGTDGAAGLTDAILVGADGLTRTGMYALRKQPVSVLLLADVTTWTLGSTINALCISEGWYAPISGPQGQTVASAQVLGGANVAGYGVKYLMGDWLYLYDTINAVVRLMSPASVIAGLLAQLSPEQSTLNKPLVGILGSQRAGMAATGQSATFSDAEKQALFLANVDLIANPSPGGGYWSAQRGLNASGIAAINGDNYTRMTNFLAVTMANGMGAYIGQTITTTLFGNVRATLLGLLSNLLQQGMLDATYGTPYAVQCDATNNPLNRTGIGYLQADVQVRLMGIVLFLNVNLADGQTVTVTTTQGA